MRIRVGIGWDSEQQLCAISERGSQRPASTVVAECTSRPIDAAAIVTPLYQATAFVARRAGCMDGHARRAVSRNGHRRFVTALPHRDRRCDRVCASHQFPESMARTNSNDGLRAREGRWMCVIGGTVSCRRRLQLATCHSDARASPTKAVPCQIHRQCMKNRYAHTGVQLRRSTLQPL
jgi:hypothetical protein